MSTSWLFVQNSTSRSACPHAQITLANDEEPTLCCRSCGKRWTFVPAGETPRYCAENDPSYPGMLDNRGWSRSARVAITEDVIVESPRGSTPVARRWRDSGVAWFWTDDRSDFGSVFLETGRYVATTIRGSASFEDLVDAKTFVEEHSS